MSYFVNLVCDSPDTFNKVAGPFAGGETESDRLYNLAYNSGLKGQERAAAIKDYLECAA